MSAITAGMDHLGLAVLDLQKSVDCLGWTESGRDDSYPRAAVSDGSVRLTLWQVDHSLAVTPFDRKTNVGLHHVAFRVASEADLVTVANQVRDYPETRVEFEPEPVGDGPRKHLMCYEPGGCRVEFIWSGS